MIKNRLAARVAAILLAGAALLTTASAPAFAAGSRIDVGWTELSNGKVRGSGSYTNGNDYTRVCIGIVRWTWDFTRSTMPAGEACRSTPDWTSGAFSAPDVSLPGGCYYYETRVVAQHKNPNLRSFKYSNRIYVC
jgi:hypothetical protein